MIYCVEDDPGIRNMVVYTLSVSGFEAEGFPDGRSFFAGMDRCRPELIMLDIMLPGEDGLDILRRLKNSPATAGIPVIMATARGTEYDSVVGLDSGADDYLVKPFGMMEMVSRVKAVLRRAAPKTLQKALRAGPVALDPAAHSVTVDGAPVTLTLKEFELLRVLMSAPGRVFTRDQLLGSIWGYDFDGETRTVDVHVRTLRSKLGEAGVWVDTVRGVGYRIKEAAQ